MMSRTVTFLLLSVLFASCTHSSLRKSIDYRGRAIVYVFPKAVNQLLIKELQKTEDSSFLCLSKDSSYYRIAICGEFSKLDYYPMNTNRVAFINGHFYRLVFVEDFIFGTKDTPSYLKEMHEKKKEIELHKSYYICEGYEVEFRTDGKIISIGYGASNPVN